MELNQDCYEECFTLEEFFLNWKDRLADDYINQAKIYLEEKNGNIVIIDADKDIRIFCDCNINRAKNCNSCVNAYFKCGKIYLKKIRKIKLDKIRKC